MSGNFSPAGPSRDGRRGRRWLLPAAVAAPTVIAALPVVGFREGQAIGFLALVPLLASLTLSWRRTALVSAYTLAVGVALLVAQPGPSRGSDTLRLAAVAAVAALAVANAALLQRREARLRAITEVAQVTQRALQPTVPSRAGTWTLATVCESAAEHAAVGGDVIEVLHCERGTRVLLADARGNGLPAIGLAVAARSCFRAIGTRPGLSLTEVARLVDRTVASCGHEEDFVTALFLELHDTGWVEVVNCGHPPPLRMAGTGGLTALSPRCYTRPLGIDPEPRCDVFAVAPGERVIAFTDGLLEARDAAGEMFDVATLAAALAAPTPAAALTAVIDTVREHTGGQVDDDIAVLVAQLDETADGAPATRG